MNVKFVKDLSIHGTNLIKILNDVVLGSMDIKPYNSTSIYNTGDPILYYNLVTSKYELQKSINDGVTGIYNSSDWVAFDPIITTSGIDCGSF